MYYLMVIVCSPKAEPEYCSVSTSSEYQSQNISWVFPEDSADGFRDSALGDGEKEGNAEEVDHDYEGGRPDEASALDVLLPRSGLEDEGMDVEGVCESYQGVNDDHIIEPYAEKAHWL